LKKLVAELRADLGVLRDDNAVLRKNSGNSSNPPSSDIVKPPKDNQKTKKHLNAESVRKKVIQNMIEFLLPKIKLIYTSCT
jgi:hypothetical protein